MFENQRIIAHRGLYDNIKVYENTIEAFKLAIEKKYIIEIDVHLTKDNQLIVYHDYNTKRLLKNNLIIEESTYKELNKENLIHIPTIEEVLKIVKGKVPLLIEIKQPSTVGKLETELMNILNKYKGEYAIQSFNPKTVYWFKKNYPNILRGQLSCKYYGKKINKIEKYILSNMLFNIITKPNFISYKYDELSIDKINKYKSKGLKVLGWTIKTKKEYDKYIKYYDNLICEKFIYKDYQFKNNYDILE